ncbi:MAG: glycosyltransferase family 39 protein [Candidatus Fermentibacter sp.]|nr:glycosyltransferase family 39 protein [Candidatus Fermentibacter sp.]
MALLAAIALLRTALVIVVGIPATTASVRSWPMEDDSYQYVDYARELLDGRQGSAAMRMPLYPAFLAVTWSDGHPWLAALLIQQAAGLAIGILCYLITRPSCPGAAPAAGAAAMLLPQHVVLSTRIMPDTFALLAVVLSGYLWTLALRTRSTRTYTALWGALGLTLSIGAVTKQVLLMSPSVYIALIAFEKARRPAVRLPALAVMLAVFSVLPLSWREFNRRSFGLDAFSAQDAFEPLGRAAVLAGVTDVQSVWSGRFTAPLDSLAMAGGEIDPGARDSIYRVRTREIVLAHPVEVLVPHLTSWPKFFSLGYAHKILRASGMEERDPALTAWKAALALLYLAMAAGACTALLVPAIRSRTWPLIGLFLGWAVFSAAVYGPLATTRYGVTFYWAMAILACAAYPFAAARRCPGQGSAGFVPG